VVNQLAGHKLRQCPPLADGFASYLGKPAISAAASASLTWDIAKGTPSSYGSHPPIKDRLASLEKSSQAAEPFIQLPANPAISLLHGLDELEKRLLVSMTNNPNGCEFPHSLLGRRTH
jgi:hypothetical protein